MELAIAMDGNEILARVLRKNQERNIYGLLDRSLKLCGDVLETVVLDGYEYLLLLHYTEGRRTGIGYVLRKSDSSFVVTIQFDEREVYRVIQRENVEEGILECDDGRRWEGTSCSGVVSGSRCPYGECKYYDEEGTLSFVGVLTEQSMSGYGVEYYESGKPKCECVCIRGKRFGVAKEYDRNGSFIHYTQFVDNRAFFFMDAADGWSSQRLVADPSFTSLSDSVSFVSSMSPMDSLILSAFSFIEHISVTGMNNVTCSHVEIASLPRLVDVSFGDYSFSLGEGVHPYSPEIVKSIQDANRILLIHDCHCLEFVSFGVYAFSSFMRLSLSSFTLLRWLRLDLPRLTKLVFGEKGQDSYNFYWNECLSTENTPSLQSIEAGDFAFYWCDTLRLSNAENLRVECGESAFSRCGHVHVDHENSALLLSEYPSFMYYRKCRPCCNKQRSFACG